MMEGIIKKIFRFLGIDRTVGFLILGRCWSVLAGPISLILIVSCLNKVEQGFYYTFFSISGLTVFFELGLASVVMQFASHEKANLQWATDGTIQGSADSKSRLAHLFKKSLQWYFVIAILVLIFLGVFGVFFFDHNSRDYGSVNWMYPWLILVIFQALSLPLSACGAILEGLGLIQEISKLRLMQTMMSALLTWTALLLGFKLFATVFMSLAGVIIGSWYILYAKRNIFIDLWRTSSELSSLSWLKEIWPMQWRVAVSWLSGYFLTQIITPIFFALRNPIDAGQWGFTYGVVSVIVSVSLYWFNARAPQFGVLVAKKNYSELDGLFFRTLKQSLTVSVLGLSLFVALAIVVSDIATIFSSRMLTITGVVFLALAAVAYQILMAGSVYLRAHKKEPLFLLMLILGCINAGAVYLLADRVEIHSIAALHFILILLIGIFGGGYIFRLNRTRWHTTTETLT
ncbi:MAG TPA: hypothetical protein PLN27_16840 [Acidobacteriota bacterium]|nr:hypothetical protein [Acidobacteriota bacterium]